MVKIGYPYDPLAVANKKLATLKDQLTTRGRAWHGYVKTLSLAYGTAYGYHTTTLSQIREKIRSDVEFMRTVLFGAILPSALGGGMAVLVTGGGAKEMMKGLYEVSTRNQKLLLDMAVGGLNSVTKDVTKLEGSNILNSVIPKYGSEWDSVAAKPLDFFLKLDRAIDDFGTDAVHDLEVMRGVLRNDTLDDYIAKIDSYLLSPFIQKAPMDRDRLYTEDELWPAFEAFMWVVWAKQRDVNYWSTQIGRSTEPDDRSTLRKLWDTASFGISDDDDLERSEAEAAVERLDPILYRLGMCGINLGEVTQSLGEQPNRRFLNILWVRFLGQKHRGSLFGDLVDTSEAKQPKSVFAGGPITKTQRII